MSKPLVLVDADPLGRMRTGDESYVENLLRALGQEDHGLRLGAVTRHPELVPKGIEPLHLPARSQIVRMSLTLPRLLRETGSELAHVLYVVPPLYRGPAVVTIHDLSFERFPELMAPRDRILFRTLVPRSARRAARILTGSEWTKQDLIERYRIPDEKIIVTPYGIDPAFGPGNSEPGAPAYALLVGALQPRKDPLTALQALARLDPAVRLVFAGPEKRGGEHVRRAIDELGLSDRVEIRGHVSKKELADLYQGAACLIFPSRYEGFGLPVLEAMASGTPVVATRVGAIPEVAGGAAILVDPGDPDALADGIERALANHERLTALGLERARAFSWAATARATLAVYRELV